MQKDSFVFYKSFYNAIKKLPEEYQLEMYNAITYYCFEGKEPENLSGIAEAMFILMKPNIDNAEKRYNASVENGKKGGRPKKNENLKKPNKNLTRTKIKPNTNLNADDDVDVYVDDNVDVYVDDDVDIKDVISSYENNIAPITDITLQILMEYCNILSPALVLEAIKKATVANVRTGRYIEGILRNWQNKGFKKLVDVKNEELDFRRAKEELNPEETDEERTNRKLKELEEHVNANSGIY